MKIYTEVNEADSFKEFKTVLEILSNQNKLKDFIRMLDPMV